MTHCWNFVFVQIKRKKTKQNNIVLGKDERQVSSQEFQLLDCIGQ